MAEDSMRVMDVLAQGETAVEGNGYGARRWDTRVGTLELATPKPRTGSYFPRWLGPARWSRGAARSAPWSRWSPRAYVKGVSTRKVESLGLAGKQEGGQPPTPPSPRSSPPAPARPPGRRRFCQDRRRRADL